MKDAFDRTVASIRGSQTLRLFFLVFLALLLQIPIAMIGRLVTERQERRQGAVTEVSSKWGNAQSITGPALVVPYIHQWTEAAAGGQQVTRTETRNAVFLPERLHIGAKVDSDIRNRGIFAVPVYKLDLTVDGEFARPNFADLGINPTVVDWKRAHLALGISDARAIQQESSVTWNEKRVPFLPGTGGFAEGGTGIHAPVGLSDTTQRVSFSFPLTLNGSQSLDVVPFGRTTVVEMQGDHGSPSFQGNWLPAERTVTDSSFTAKWSISFLGRSYPQAWISDASTQEAINNSRFGVQLVSTVDHYRMAARSVKYAFLFILLTFATVWLIEILAGVRVHTIQYLMLGAALCLFYLLELSLSEHLGFPFAYVLASAAVVGMVAAYSLVILRRPARAMIIAVAVTLLYAYLYLLLMTEDYALLIGSVGLFAILGAIMYATRRVDWYSVGDSSLARKAPPD
jgi:inner membrane protein